MYCLNNPVKFVDPTGCLESTHTDSLGYVVAVFDDGDLGVYRHNTDQAGTMKELDEQYSETNTSGNGEYMGETEYWDEFGTEEKPYNGARISFGTNWDFWIEKFNEEATQFELPIIALRSLPGGKYDIKRSPVLSPDGAYTGRLLKGKYASARSAGNFLAGMNGATGTINGQHISLTTYMRMAGVLHREDLRGLFSPPYYGEVEYAGRRIVAGFNHGVYKTVSINWIAR